MEWFQDENHVSVRQVPVMLGGPGGALARSVCRSCCTAAAEGLTVISAICHSAEVGMACPTPLWWWHMERNVSQWAGCGNEG